MIIEFKPSVFGIDKSLFKSFNYLFQKCTEYERYEIVIDYVKVKDTEVYKRLDYEDRDLIESVFNAQMVRQSSQNVRSEILKADYYVSTEDNGEKSTFNLDEAHAFFGQKISILLENSRNDAYFIKSLVQHFDTSGKIKKHLKYNWISFDNAGGCKNFENYLLEKFEEYDHLPRPNNTYFRGFALVDSDRESDLQPPIAKHHNLVDFLENNNVAYHVLEKRAMENYMPDAVFDQYNNVQNADWLTAFKYLTPRQKDYLDITKGFPKKNGSGDEIKDRSGHMEDIINLYDGVSDSNFDKLNFGLKIAHYKREFPRNFLLSHNVYKNSLLEKVAHQNDPDELSTILKKIASLL